jgi:hypothetical protein
MSAEKPSAVLMRLLLGFQVSQAIHVAATLGIADALADGPRSSDELAAALGAHPPTLYRLLRALASVGVLREQEGRRFALTPQGECLRSDTSEPVAPYAVFIGQQRHWETWGHLLHSVLTGENAFQHLYGMPVWEARALDPEAGTIFDRAMTATSLRQADAVTAAYDFGQFQQVVDVAGGQGALLAAILARHTALRGVLFDQPHVVEQAAPVLEAAGVTERCQVVGGSFFETLPEGGDAYVLKAIIHDWEDAESIAILQGCRRAIAPHGRLLVIERELGPPNERPDVKFSDLNMLVLPGGRERTGEEFEELFAAAGFRLANVIPTGAGVSIFEGLPE